MRELSLNLLDIVENSLAAGSSLVKIFVDIFFDDDEFSFKIEDDGCGMSEETLKKVCDPFTTSRTTRSVGLGIPLFKFAAESAGGRFEISSKKGVGTSVFASFKISHIDRMPLGDFGGVVMQLITMNENVDFYVRVCAKDKCGVLDTREFKEIMGDGFSFNVPEMRNFLREFINENLVSIIGGKL